MRKITLIFLLLFIVGCGSNISFAKRHKVWKPKKTRLLDRRYERCPQMGL
jgi:hypothetical protein